MQPIITRHVLLVQTVWLTQRGKKTFRKQNGERPSNFNACYDVCERIQLFSTFCSVFFFIPCTRMRLKSSQSIIILITTSECFQTNLEDMECSPSLSTLSVPYKNPLEFTLYSVWTRWSKHRKKKNCRYNFMSIQ